MSQDLENARNLLLQFGYKIGADTAENEPPARLKLGGRTTRSRILRKPGIRIDQRWQTDMKNNMESAMESDMKSKNTDRTRESTRPRHVQRRS